MTRTCVNPAVERPALKQLLRVAALVALFGIGLAAVLNHFKFQSALEAAARTRMAVPVAAVRESVHASLLLGLPLSSAQAVPELLAREQQADTAISEIAVFESGGRVLFSSRRESVGHSAPEAWQKAARAGVGWHLHEGQSAVLGVPLLNAFDLPQGQVAVRYALDTER